MYNFKYYRFRVVVDRKRHTLPLYVLVHISKTLVINNDDAKILMKVRLFAKNIEHKMKLSISYRNENKQLTRLDMDEEDLIKVCSYEIKRACSGKKLMMLASLEYVYADKKILNN